MIGVRVDIRPVRLFGINLNNRDHWRAYVAHVLEHAMQRGDARVVRRSTPLVLLTEQHPVLAVAERARQHHHALTVAHHPIIMRAE